MGGNWTCDRWVHAVYSVGSSGTVANPGSDDCGGAELVRDWEGRLVPRFG